MTKTRQIGIDTLIKHMNKRHRAFPITISQNKKVKRVLIRKKLNRKARVKTHNKNNKRR